MSPCCHHHAPPPEILYYPPNTAHQSDHLEISQSSIPSRIVSRWRSIPQNEYRCLAAPAALRWAGPAPPFLASSCDLQMHVARFRPSISGVPNQYLPQV